MEFDDVVAFPTHELSFVHDLTKPRSLVTNNGTLNPAGNNLFYEGWNVAQELSGTTPTANRILGGIDEPAEDFLDPLTLSLAYLASAVADKATTMPVMTIINFILTPTNEPYKSNGFVRFHSFQSIGFAICWAALTIANDSIRFPVRRVNTLLSGIWLLCFVMWIVLMVKAYRGQRFKLPIVGDLAARWAA